MNQLKKIIANTLSVRISLMVVLAVALLLGIALFVMFSFSRKALRQEALEKAGQTLTATVQHTDNVLLSVEQASGNIYWDMTQHLDEPDRMFDYCRELLEANPYINGCAIAFEPYYYKSRGQYFMAYLHHEHSGQLNTEDSHLIQSETFGNVPYTEQSWYTLPLESRHPSWVGPLKNEDAEDEALISFCLPIYNKEGRAIGVLGVDVTLALLSDIVLSAKPSPNSYAVLLGSDGSFIVHPDSTKLLHETVFSVPANDTDPEVEEAARAMVAGETGYRHFRLDGVDSYVFYKPFTRAVVPGRSMNKLGWSAGIIYPEDDIFGDYNQLLYIVLAIAGIGLLVLLVLCQLFTHHQLLPLRMLTESARRISEGHYDETIPDSRHHDEVGRLQANFRQMQLALSANMGELERLNETLRERGAGLAEAYEQAREADHMKTAVLHNMTNQMLTPVNAISSNVDELCHNSRTLKPAEVQQLVTDILHEGENITDVLNDLLEVNNKKK